MVLDSKFSKYQYTVLEPDTIERLTEVICCDVQAIIHVSIVLRKRKRLSAALFPDRDPA